MPATLGEVKSKSYMRQEGIIAPDVLKEAKIVIIGAGAVGSFVTLSLAKMGCSNIEVFDNDIVQSHNLPNQFYRLCDLDKPKVIALQEIIKMYEGIDITVHNERYNGQSLKGIVISAVDSLDVRKFIWEQIRGSEDTRWYIDTRMGGLLMRIFTVDISNTLWKGQYEKMIMNPKAKDSLMEIKCTARSILYNVLFIAGLASSLVVKILKGEKVPGQVIFDFKTYTFIKE